MCRHSYLLVVAPAVMVAVTAIAFALMLPEYNFVTLEPVNLKEGAAWFGDDAQRAELEYDKTIRPFVINVDDSVLVDLRARLTAGIERYEAAPSLDLSAEDWSYGASKPFILELARYWRDTYDWRKSERALNRFPQYLTRIDGLDVHFVHVRAQPKLHQRVQPLLIVHGWPGSILEFHKLIEPLTSSDDSDIVFDVVAPSLPGYAFSEAPHKPGVSPVEVGAMFMKLMERLGYSKYVVQGGDWGALVVNAIALMDTEHCQGLHTNFITAPPSLRTLLFKIIPTIIYPRYFISDYEEAKVMPLRNQLTKMIMETGYFHEQATRPETLAVGLADSPIGLLAWITEKFYAWTDRMPTGRLLSVLTREEILANVMLYWSTNSIASSVRLYREFAQSPLSQASLAATVTVPAAVIDFPKEMLRLPLYWIGHKYSQLVQYTNALRGGHFAALEQPQVLANDLRRFVSKLPHMK